MDLYLVELYDADEGICYSEVVRAWSLHDAAWLCGTNAVVKGGLPEDDDWFDASVAKLFVPDRGVCEELLVGHFRVIRRDDGCVVEVTGG